MMKKLAPLLALAALPLALSCGAPADAPEAEATGGEATGSAVPEGTPRLVLLIVVDQMRGDYLERFRPLLNHGLARLLQEGIVFTDAHHFHAATETAPGHATLATGVFPKRHGIIANSWFDRERGEDVYCCGDPDHGVSPRNMLVPTLGDLLKAAYPETRVYAASAKDRAAILMGGHHADGAWWYGRSRGTWVTSTYYGDQENQPAWVEAFNDEDRLAAHFANAWTPLVPLAHTSAYDIEPLDRGPVIDTFPHAVGGFTVERGAFYGDVYRSPFVDGYLEDFAEALIEAENLGADEIPDLLAISFSALDTVGHGYGPNAPETLDVILRLDRTIGELLDFVDERIGMENVVVALSSDHGVGEVPELVVRDGGDGGRFGTEQTLCLQRLQSRLKGRFGGGEFLLDTFYLDGETITAEEANRGAIEDEIIEAMSGCPLIAEVIRPAELDPANPLHELYLNGYYPERSGDLILVPKPNVLPVPASVVVASHGSPYTYDTHVPLIIRRQDGAGRVVPERANTIDLAPTLAGILGLRVDGVAGFEGFDGVDRLAGP
ncbi:MAG: alkaline phosphatase family protein [Acidobacteria bacterium]|nr:alkaline phosphatase family protein [Acidobacteriota bacterium]